jgi:hypothetical protein
LSIKRQTEQSNERTNGSDENWFEVGKERFRKGEHVMRAMSYLVKTGKLQIK